MQYQNKEGFDSRRLCLTLELYHSLEHCCSTVDESYLMFIQCWGMRRVVVIICSAIWSHSISDINLSVHCHVGVKVPNS